MKRYSVLFLSMIMIVTGCSLFLRKPPPPQELLEAMEQARENFDAVERLPVYEKYAHNFQEAESELVHAENYLQDHLYEKASLAAQKSLEASQWILRQFYKETIALSAQKAKAKIAAISDEDPGNPLQDFLPEINNILDYSEGIGNGQQEVDITKVLQDFDKITKIEHTTQKTMKQTLESDASFGPGEYEISDKGKEALEFFDLQSLASRTVRELSLGQRRRAVFAAALIGKPSHLLLDEPLEGMDRKIKEEILAWTERRLEVGAAMIVVSHIIEPFLQSVSRAVTVKDGSISLFDELPADSEDRLALLDNLAKGIHYQ